MDHIGNCQLAAVKYRGKVYVQYFFPVLRRHILEQANVGDPGIVYQYIHTAKLLFDLFKHFLTAAYISHISGIGQAGCLIGFDFFFCLKQSVFIADTADRHIIALFRKFDCNGFPDSTGSSCYKYSFTRHRNSPFDS